jgi:hypothetical protein
VSEVNASYRTMSAVDLHPALATMSSYETFNQLIVAYSRSAPKDHRVGIRSVIRTIGTLIFLVILFDVLNYVCRLVQSIASLLFSTNL